MLKNEYTDEELIQALRQGGGTRQKAWEYMYKSWTGVWERVVCDLGGNPDEANEAFHEVAMTFEKVLRKPEFQLKTAALKTYLVTCVKNRWLRKRRKQTREPSNPTREELEIRDVVDDLERQLMKDDLRQSVDHLLNTLGERCRRVLRMFSQGFSMEEIAAAEDWKDAGKAKKEKYECQEKLKNYLRDNPDIAQHLKDLLHG